MSTKIVELKDIKKSYPIGGTVLPVLKNINFSIDSGDLISIMGASGSGKSTLMNIIGLLDRYDSGCYYLQGKEVHLYQDDELASIRNKMIGFVFQSFFLLPKLTALQNVNLPLLYRGVHGKDSKERCYAILEKVGMVDFAKHHPNELSGGQQQRVAIARALVGNPTVILADEPTGALDSKIGQEIMDLFISLNEKEDVTIVLITHDINNAKQCKKIVSIKDGVITDQDRTIRS